MKANQGQYTIETEAGTYDLVDIANDAKEMSVINLLKKDIEECEEFPQARNGSVCLSSIAAFIAYIVSTTELCRQYDAKTDKLH